MAGHSSSDLNLDRGASADVKSYYLGLYSTWLDAASGYYFDGVVKLNRFDNSSEVTLSDGKRTKGDYDNLGLGVSAEFGRHVELGNGYFVEPYTQWSAVSIEGKDYQLDNGLRANSDDTRSLLGKVGATVGRTYDLGQGASLSHTCAWHTLMSSSTVTTSKSMTTVSTTTCPAHVVNWGRGWRYHLTSGCNCMPISTTAMVNTLNSPGGRMSGCATAGEALVQGRHWAYPFFSPLSQETAMDNADIVRVRVANALPAPTAPAALPNIPGGVPNLMPIKALADPVRLEFTLWQHSRPTPTEPESVEIFCEGVKVGDRRWTQPLPESERFVEITPDCFSEGTLQFHYVGHVYNASELRSDDLTLTVDKTPPVLGANNGRLQFPELGDSDLTEDFLLTHGNRLLA